MNSRTVREKQRSRWVYFYKSVWRLPETIWAVCVNHFLPCLCVNRLLSFVENYSTAYYDLQKKDNELGELIAKKEEKTQVRGSSS